MKTPSPFPNTVCWQRDSRRVVMNPVALGVRPSIFNATHYPSPIRKLNVAAAVAASTPYSEESLLKDFLEPGAERLFCVAVGDSGVGKSHLIRWLHQKTAELRNKHFFLIPIPRQSANLAEVLRHIIADSFHGDAVEAIRRELAGTANVTAQGGRARVLDQLAFVLEPENRHQAGLRSIPDDETHKEIILPFLPAVLRDNALRQFLSKSEKGIVARLAQHVLGVRSDVSAVSLKWTADDLSFPANIVNMAGKDAKELASAFLHDEPLKRHSAEVLNAALEEALPGLIGLKRGNLMRAMIEIRRQLKSEKRELLLFLEDLSVSQGLDSELIESLLIKPSEESEPICAIRSIVGVTHADFHSMQANIKGRIDFAAEFNVDLGADGFREEDLVDFASRYLNAARYNLTELDRWNEQKDAEELPTFCETSHCPNREQCHKIFGEKNGRGLYPFNRVAVSRLYKKLHGEERTAFNPRAFVKGVLDEFLQSAEVQLLAGSFPGSDFRDTYLLSTETSADVQLKVKNTFGAAAPRVQTALEIYSPGPNAGKLPAGLPEIFSLPARSGGLPKEAETNAPIPREETIRPVPPPEQDEFDRWLNKKLVDDAKVNEWRRVVYDAVKGARDWDTDPFGPPFFGSFQSRFIHFEGQTVTRSGDVKLEIAPTPEIATALRGLVRGFKSQDETLYALDLLDCWTDEICTQLKQRTAVSGEIKPIDAAIRLLALGAILRQAVTEEMTLEQFLSAILGEWNPTVSPTASNQAWMRLKDAFIREGPALRDWVLDSIGAGKGGGVTSLVIDAAQISKFVASAHRRLDLEIFAENFGQDWSPFFGPVTRLGQTVGRLFSTALEQETTRARKWLETVEIARGEHTLRALGTVLKTALSKSIEAAAVKDQRASDLLNLCEPLANGSRDALLKMAASVTDKSLNRRLIAIANLDRPVMEETTECLSACDNELRQTSRALARTLEQTGGRDVEKLQESLKKEFSDLCEKIETLIGGTNE